MSGRIHYLSYYRQSCLPAIQLQGPCRTEQRPTNFPNLPMYSHVSPCNPCIPYIPMYPRVSHVSHISPCLTKYLRVYPCIPMYPMYRRVSLCIPYISLVHRHRDTVYTYDRYAISVLHCGSFMVKLLFSKMCFF
jgi:hypothetical protein